MVNECRGITVVCELSEVRFSVWFSNIVFPAILDFVCWWVLGVVWKVKEGVASGGCEFLLIYVVISWILQPR